MQICSDAQHKWLNEIHKQTVNWRSQTVCCVLQA